MTADQNIFPATVMPDRDWWAALWPDPAATLRALGITPDMTVLDLCCGDGWFTAPLAVLTGGKVFALDLNPAMLEAARAEAERTGATVLEWIEGDARDAGTLLPQRIDFVLIANTFHGVPDQTGLARAAAACLQPRGRFAVVNWHARPREETPVLGSPRGPKTDMRMTPEATSDVVGPAGFVLDELVELPPYHYGAVFRLQLS
ncbi:MAG: class I SAM-dependent methyltransferase [Alphaproteobacteria bacterium]|nr:class I SAM-dependent methyltransferase [Alphaproteobacteria bacterium]